ncbi:hypothetical protein [Halorubrum sp. ARQ200]|uniref:hypothetical protein n=1 Tax=Halorubrum sp. ARQ200 TaxID=1855872 RepID=UPI0010FA0833|nr:hypothetical protein [Halorubrum sp. ARQ200]TKX45169.1 hypothetical protein EXE50_04175 [Halorubrum sp. ARQ200]
MSDNNPDFIDYWNAWGLSPDEFNEIFNNNENVYSALFGYLSEKRVTERYFRNNEKITNLQSPRDHDTSKKGDIIFDYKGEEIIIEVKSLDTQPGDIQITDDMNGERKYMGTVQMRESDYIERTLQTGETIETSLIEIGLFDILAVNMFEYFDEYKFMFARSEDLTRSDVHPRLIASSPEAKYPPEINEHVDYRENPFELIEEIIEERNRGGKKGENQDEREQDQSELKSEDTSLQDFTD